MQSLNPPGHYSPPVLEPLPPEEWPSVEHLITEDGAPVDSVFGEKQMRLLTESLYSSWQVNYPFVAFANVGLFYGSDIPPVVPDVLLSVNVRLPEDLFPKLNRSYFVWAYGKPPEVAIEIVSNRKGGEDTDKLRIYADVRVSYYFIYDPDHHLSNASLRGFQLRGSGYEPMPGNDFRIGNLGLGLQIWSGRFEDTDSQWLRWVDAEGKLIHTGAERAQEELQRANSEAQRADSEALRADCEAQRAEAAIQMARIEGEENRRLMELLRRHGIDPTT